MSTVNNLIKPTLWISVLLLLSSCVPELANPKESAIELPDTYSQISFPDSLNAANIEWQQFFNDSILISLIDTALEYNQEYNLFTQRVRMRGNEVLSRSGEYLPHLNIGADAGVTRSGEYSLDGAAERQLQINPGNPNSDPVPNLGLGLMSNWEIDIWNKLHDAKDAAVANFMGSEQGQIFMKTQLISEIATKYYELLALDSQLEILHRNIRIQSDALATVRLQKESARVTELAVRKFEAEVFHTRSLEFLIQQEITATENELKLLIGVPLDSIPRSALDLESCVLDPVYVGVPIDLIANRADIREAEYRILAANLSVSAARKSFYPSVDIGAGAGVQSASGSLLFSTPSSMMYNLLGGVSAPLLNRRALTAEIYNADAEQRIAVLEYDQAVLRAFTEVNTQLSGIQNISASLDLQSQEVAALTSSVEISTNLFKSARADYMEVLLTQRDALRSKFEWVDTKRDQLIACVNLYRSLGGGWK
ncbi:MAG: TolC family protein [Flavobacteriia bacterium]|nr:TolC family protein [Flavobacteriia bacterium]